MKIKYLLISTSLFAGILLSGCYTVLTHPEVVSKDEESGLTQKEEVMFYNDCNSCHKNGAEHQYTSMDSIDQVGLESSHRPINTYPHDVIYYDTPGYYDNTYYGSDIGYYYNYPWWYSVRESYSAGTTKYRTTKESNSGRTKDAAVIRNGSDSGRRPGSDHNTGNTTPPPPARVVNSGSDNQPNSSSTSIDNKDRGNRSESTSSSNQTRNSGNDNRSSNDDSRRQRNNDGGRSTGSSGRGR